MVMSDEIKIPQLKQDFMSREIKDDLQQLGFVLSNTPESGVMWGFDGKTKYFPRDTYIRDSIEGKPKIKLRIEKTNQSIAFGFFYYRG